MNAAAGCCMMHTGHGRSWEELEGCSEADGPKTGQRAAGGKKTSSFAGAGNTDTSANEPVRLQVPSRKCNGSVTFSALRS